jgi:RimJ/RimL family protein N-acetyltransferase
MAAGRLVPVPGRPEGDGSRDRVPYQVCDREIHHLSLAALSQARADAGDVMLFPHSRVHTGGELGYMFSPGFSGRGYATEAASAAGDRTAATVTAPGDRVS